VNSQIAKEEAAGGIDAEGARDGLAGLLAERGDQAGLLVEEELVDRVGRLHVGHEHEPIGRIGANVVGEPLSPDYS